MITISSDQIKEITTAFKKQLEGCGVDQIQPLVELKNLSDNSDLNCFGLITRDIAKTEKLEDWEGATRCNDTHTTYKDTLVDIWFMDDCLEDVTDQVSNYVEVFETVKSSL